MLSPEVGHRVIAEAILPRLRTFPHAVAKAYSKLPVKGPNHEEILLNRLACSLRLATASRPPNEMEVTAMTKDERDILELLKEELDFIEKGGYGRSVRTPWHSKSTFQDS